jgi:hypothetical protein
LHGGARAARLISKLRAGRPAERVAPRACPCVVGKLVAKGRGRERLREFASVRRGADLLKDAQ